MTIPGSLRPPPPAPSAPQLARRPGRKRPQAQLRAAIADVPNSEWASLFGDLTRPALRGASTAPVEWRIHDKTHLEFAIDYPLGTDPPNLLWEAYFFVPESFRLHEATYTKKAIYDDIQSYVRYAVPELHFEELASTARGSDLDELARALDASKNATDDSKEAAAAMRSVRLMACLVRASGLTAIRDIEAEIAEAEFDKKRIEQLILSFIVTCAQFAQKFRGVLFAERSLPESVQVATRWADEDVSLALEALCADLALRIEQEGRIDAELPDLAEKVASRAVEEARHRVKQGYSSIGAAEASSREIEHLEFRRHVLKRFTASVLWLSVEMSSAATWVVQTLYAVAAGIAMAFALAATFRIGNLSDNIFRAALLVVASYAAKDRMKAFLQSAFSRWVEKRYPDRLWSIFDRERKLALGKAHERAGFVPFRHLPPDVLETRRLTREHALEEQARQERVIWHEKRVDIAGDVPGLGSRRFPMLTEIFRLNVGHWLAHTDDPNRRVVFADPDDASLYSATARRVYNINVIYRLRREDEKEAAWHRIRVVVSRKGIERIDPIR